MSGSPVIQNEKFAGAVTHVFVQDSTSGYGIFAETMLENSGKISNESRYRDKLSSKTGQKK